MPASYQATVVNATSSTPILDLKRPAGMSEATQRKMLAALGEYNAEHETLRGDNSNLAARIASYELAFKMQSSAPEATDIDNEPEHIKELYGLNEKRTQAFGRQCLLARRLVERNVRFIRSTRAARTWTRPGTRTTTWSRTTVSMPAKPTSPSRACSRT
jgi:hypothetical protein